MKICGIYAILHRKSGRRYVGQSIDIKARYRAHMGALRRGEHYGKRLQRAYLRDGPDAFMLVIIEECPAATLTEREQFWMDSFAPTGLYNVSSAAVAPRGRVVSEDARARMSAAKKGKPSPLKGVPRSAETVAKMRAAMAGRKLTPAHRAKLCGRTVKHTAEARAKMSAASRGKPKSEAARQAMSEAAKGRRASPETRRKMSESQQALVEQKRAAALEQWSRPGFREAASASRRGRKTSDASKAAIGEQSAARWADPEYRERMSAKNRQTIMARSPEQRSAITRKAWETRRARAAPVKI